ncbi:calponin homology domain-containing protein DDB_G0272472-like isoform X3 [Argonauta hians]
MLKFVKNLGKFSPSSRRLSIDKNRNRSDSLCVDYDGNNLPSSSCSSGIYTVRDKELGKLHKAAWYGQLEKIKTLARRDPSPLDKCHRTPLHLACCQGYADIVQELLAWNARTSISDKEGKTPFMKAVQCGHSDVVEVLLSYKVDAEARDNDGNTCLHLAVLYGQQEILNALLNAHANANLKNMAGRTPLHCAVTEDRFNIVMCLLQSRADINSIDNEHKTALILACQNGNENMVSLLLKYQAAVQVKDANGWTARDHAHIKGFNSCAQLIENYQKAQKLQFSEDSIDLDDSTASKGSLKKSNFSFSKRRVSVTAGHGPLEILRQSENQDNSAESDGSDGWGDDTESIALDDNNKKGRISFAKFIPEISDREELDTFENPYSTIDLNTEGCTDKPLKNLNHFDSASASSRNVSTNGKEEISEPIYATVNKPKKLTLEQQRAFMAELGLSDSEDLIDVADSPPPDIKPIDNNCFDDVESDWDSVLTDDIPKKKSQPLQLFNEDVFPQFDDPVVTGPEPTLSTFKFNTSNDASNKDENLIDKNDWDSSCLSSQLDSVKNIPSGPNQNKSETNQYKEEIDEDKDQTTEHDCAVNLKITEVNQPVDKPNGNISKEMLHQMSSNKESENPDFDSDWDSPVSSENQLKLGLSHNVECNLQYLQHTSSLRRMNSAAKNLDMAASKIIACSSKPTDYLIESSGLYKNAYEEFVSSVGVVADMTPDITAKTQIMEKLDSISDVSSRLLLVANAVSTDQTDHSAKNKLSDAARFVTECVDQLINVCSGIDTEEDEVSDLKKDGERQVNENLLFVKDSQLSRSMGELRQSYLYEPDANGNVAEEDDKVETFSGDKIDSKLKRPIEGASAIAKLSEDTLHQMRKETERNKLVKSSSSKQNGDILKANKETKDNDSGHKEGIIKNVTVIEPQLTKNSECIEPELSTSHQQIEENQQKKHSETGLEDFCGFGFLDSSDVLKDEDMLSVTSVDTDNNLSTINFEKDVLLNLNLKDPTSATKLQQYINNCQQKLKKEKNQRLLIQNQYHVLQEDNDNMQKKLQLINQEKAALDQNKINLESKISDLKYKLAEEADKCKDETLLLEQCKKQQEKMEKLYKKECEDKQEVDHSLYQTKLELKWVKTTLQRLETENEELHSQYNLLVQEGNAKLNQATRLHISQLTQTSQSVSDQNSSEMIHLREENQKLQEEISQLKMSRSQNQLSETVEHHRIIEQLQEEKKSAEILVKDIQHQMELKESTSCLEKRQMNDTIKRLKEERDKWQQDHMQVQSELDSAKQDLATFQERLNNIDRLNQIKSDDQNKLLSQLKMELEKEKGINRELQDRLSLTNRQISRLQNEEEELNALLNEKNHLLQDSKYKRDNLLEDTNEKLLSVQHCKERLENDLKSLQVEKSDLEIELRREKEKVRMLHENFGRPGNDEKESLIHELQLKDAQLQGKLNQEKHKSAMLQQLLDEQISQPDTDVSDIARGDKIQCQRTQTYESFKIDAELNHRDIAFEEEIKELRFQLKNEKEYWNKRLEQERKMLKSQLEKERRKVQMLQEKQVKTEIRIEEEEEKNRQLQCEITSLNSRTKYKEHKLGNHLSSSLPIESSIQFDTMDFGSQRNPELDQQLRIELNKKLEEVNCFLQQQHDQYEKLMAEKENKVSADKNKLLSELNLMRLNYENALSTKTLQEQEALHFRELYLKELSRYQGSQPVFYGGLDPLCPRFASLGYRTPEKSPLDLNNTIPNSASKLPFMNSGLNSVPNEVSKNQHEYDEVYDKLKEEMHRSIKRHLEAPPFDKQSSNDLTYTEMSPPIKGTTSKPLNLIELNKALSKSKSEYLTYMKQKYCL